MSYSYGKITDSGYRVKIYKHKDIEEITIETPDGRSIEFPLMSSLEIADTIIELFNFKGTENG